jgi:hypothetical protein
LRRRNEGLRRELELLQDQMDAKLTTLRWLGLIRLKRNTSL